MTGEHSQTGLADIDVILGYKFLDKDKYHFGINIAFTIPTGKEPDGREMFEPVYGNYAHFGVGGGLDAHANLWTRDEQDIKLNFMFNYRYLVKGIEHRPLGVNGYASPYILLGNAEDITNAALIPAVNVLTPYGVNVTPGSQLDGILALAYNNGGLSFDFGYNLYFRQGEDVKFRGTLTPNNYGVAARDYSTTPGTAFAVGNIELTTAGTPGTWLTNANVNTKAAATPSQCSNGIYGGLGYHFKKWDYPLLLGLGGKYDWGTSNSMPDYWTLWAKLALSF